MSQKHERDMLIDVRRKCDARFGK